jgi:N-acetylneuraminic acid mutarotase
MPTAEREGSRAVIGGRLYLFSGFHTADIKANTKVQVYDPAAAGWSDRASMPFALTHANAVTVGDTVWLAGGFVGDHPGTVTDRVWRYVASTDTWGPGPPLPAPRGAGALARVGRTLHYFGGFLPDRHTNSPDHWRLDLDGDMIWRPASPVPLARGQVAALTLGGAVYAIGGQFGHDRGARDVAFVHRYDPSADRWEEVAPLPAPRSHAENGTLEVDGRILVLGGRNNRDTKRRQDPNFQRIHAYDPALDLWVDLDDLPRAMTGAVAAVLCDQLIFVGGGLGGAEAPHRGGWALPLHDAWRPRAPMTLALGEVAGGVIGRFLYLVGEGGPATLRYDLTTNRWTPPDLLARRPFAGNHHAAEVWGGKLYLFGGFGAEGRTQIYDPTADRWRVGADMPFAGASSASAVIGDKIYVAGGIVGRATTAQSAAYDPARDAWAPIASMPAARNHAASATDGRRLFVFGGRGPGSGDSNVVANGFADLQVYDPAADSWQWSARSGLAPVPQARGGMGKAVYVNGEFLVLGGETRDGKGAGPQGVYGRVDIYDPRSNRWRVGRDMPVPRHGIFPLLVAGRVYVAGGGERAGWGRSTVLDVYAPPLPASTPRCGPPELESEAVGRRSGPAIEPAARTP